MSERVEFKVQYTEADFVRGMITAFDRSGRNWIYIGITAVSLLLGFGVVNWYVFRQKAPVDWNDLIIAIVAVVVSVPLAITLNQFRPFTESGFRKIYKDNPVLQEEFIVGVDLEGIESHSDSFESKIRWEAFKDAFETNEDIYFLVSKQQPLFFPKRGLTSEEIARFKIIATRSMGANAKFLP